MFETSKKDAIRRLQEIKTELTTNNFQASTEKTKIPAKLEIITYNIEGIKREDKKPFPNFKQIKTNWVRILDQMQDLETISAKIASEEKVRQVEEQLEKKFVVNRGHQAETELEWKAKWNEIIRTIENNKNNISNLESKTRNGSTGENNTEHEEEDDQELVDNKVYGYFQRFFQKLRIQQQSLQNFCKNWQLDCRIIALGGMIMIIIGAGCTIVVTILAIKTYTIARKVERNQKRRRRSQSDVERNGWKRLHSS